MAQGNPNPSPSTRFGAGENHNPQGKTSKQKRQEMRNAEKAVRFRGRMLDAMEAAIAEVETEDQARALLEHLNPHTLKMLKDAEDRGLGAPVQAHTSPDGSMSPAQSEAAILAAMAGKHDAEPDS